MNEHYFHCASKGLEDDVLFRTLEQFVAGMNRVAVCFASARRSFPVIIIAFCLMDNHVHFILYGTKENCLKFLEQYRRLTEMWLHYHDCSSKGKKWDFGCWLIPNKEKLMEKICYVLRNPTAAGMGIHPCQYRWGSGQLMYSDRGLVETYKTAMSEFSLTKQRRMFNTKELLPAEWSVMPDGLIWPGCYVDFKRAEGAFGNVWGFMYEMNKRNEEAINAEMYGNEISLPDKDVLQMIVREASAVYGESNPDMLTGKQRLELCRILRRSHNLDVKQMCRLLHLKVSEIKQIL